MSALISGAIGCEEDVADKCTRLSIFDWQLGIKMSVAEVARIREKAPSKPHPRPNDFHQQAARSRRFLARFLLSESSISATLVRVEIASPPPVFP